MSKYKIVGVINLLFGFPLFLLSVFYVIFVIPKMSQLYAGFGANNSGNITVSYIMVLILFITAVVNLFLGVKGFSKTSKKDTYLNYGLMAAVVTFLLSGILVSLMVISTIFPIYNLTSSM